MTNYFFSIPIYRFTSDEFYKKAKKIRDNSPKLYNSEFTLFDKVGAYSWEFNEIVGWLRLYFHYSLQVDLVMYEHSIKDWRHRLKKKKYQSRDRLTEFFINEDLTGEALTEDIVNNIIAVQKEDKNPGRYYIDFSEFRQVSNALDWAKIKKSSSPRY